MHFKPVSLSLWFRLVECHSSVDNHVGSRIRGEAESGSDATNLAQFEQGLNGGGKGWRVRIYR